VNGVDIIVTTDDAHLSPFMTTETLATPTEGVGRRSHKSSVSETDSRMYGGSSSVMSYASSYDTDNVALRHPVYSGSVVTWPWLPVSRLYESLTVSHSDIPSTPGLLSPGRDYLSHTCMSHWQCRTATSRLLRVCYHLGMITCLTPVWVADNVALRVNQGDC